MLNVRDEEVLKNPAAREPLKKMVERFKYSDVVSSDATAEIDDQIKPEIQALRAMLSSGTTEDLLAKIETISNLLSSRNRLCEMAKH